MNKYILPSAAAFLILVIAFSSYTPAMAAITSRVTLVPILQVVTIPEDDQLRQTGVMILGVGPAGTSPTQLYPKFLSQFKLIVALNGVPVHPDYVLCAVYEKDKIINPPWVTTGKTQVNVRQFSREVQETELKDVSDRFVCKVRWPSGTGGVGVLDVYYVGAAADPAFIADHILLVTAGVKAGRTVIWGSEIQDICILGWSFSAALFHTTLAGGEVIPYYVDPLSLTLLVDAGFGGMAFPSCESAVAYQLYLLANPI
jgi:hypothetical protein